MLNDIWDGLWRSGLWISGLFMLTVSIYIELLGVSFHPFEISRNGEGGFRFLFQLQVDGGNDRRRWMV